MRTSIRVEEAVAAVLSSCTVLPEEPTDLVGSVGRTVARSVAAPADVPPFANSAMDGYALAAGDGPEAPFTLRIAGEVAAGGWSADPIEPGTCVRIMTGAPVPPGTECVVPVEWTDAADAEHVTIRKVPPAGAHVRPPGQDVRRGEVVLHEGSVIGAGAVGILATLGVSRVFVRSRPRVAIVTTGNELVEPGSGDLAPGQIYNSNAYALSTQARHAGAEVLGPFHARDDRPSLDRILGEVEEADLVVFSGGVSMGRYDLVHDALMARGFVADFWKVRQRPGNPLLFGRLGSIPVLGLPGNPVSSSICFDQYARPAIAALSGRRQIHRTRYAATLSAPFVKAAGLHVFARGVASMNDDGRFAVRPTGEQGSNLFTSVLRANCIVHLPEAWDRAEAGQAVEIEWIDW